MQLRYTSYTETDQFGVTIFCNTPWIKVGNTTNVKSYLIDRIRPVDLVLLQNLFFLTQWFYSSSKGQSTKQNQKVPNEPYLLYSYQTPGRAGWEKINSVIIPNPQVLCDQSSKTLH